MARADACGKPRPSRHGVEEQQGACDQEGQPGQERARRPADGDALRARNPPGVGDAAKKQQKPHPVHHQSAGSRQRQDGQGRHARGGVLRGVAEGAYGPRKLGYAAIADQDAVRPPLARHQHRQHQQQEEN